MNYALTIGAAGYVDIMPELTPVTLMLVQNAQSGADIYFGLVPEGNRVLPATDFPEASALTPSDYQMKIRNGSAIVTANGPFPAWIRQGSILTGHAGIPASTSVLSVNNNQLVMSANATADAEDFDLTFAAPAVDATTGILITPGGIERFSTEHGSRYLQQGLRIFSTAGSTVQILKHFK